MKIQLNFHYVLFVHALFGRRVKNEQVSFHHDFFVVPTKINYIYFTQRSSLEPLSVRRNCQKLEHFSKHYKDENLHR